MKIVLKYISQYFYKRRYVFLAIGLLSLVRSVIFFYIYTHITLKIHLLFVGVGFLMMWAIWEDLAAINKLLNKWFPYEKGIVQRIILQSLLGFISVLIVGWISMPPLMKIGKVQITSAENAIAIAQGIAMTAAISLGYFGLYFFRQWKKKLLETEKLSKEKLLMQKEHAQMQYINLQNQLNPHFLFNSITSLNSLIYENQDLASDFLKQLAKVYRYVLQHKDKSLVSLQTELDFVENYLFLLKTRFGDAFDCQITISEDAREKQIVPVTLQVLIENAIKHNIMTSEEPLIIQVHNQNGYLEIKNNLQKKNIVETSNKIGLENMKSLYGYLSDNEVEIEENMKDFVVKLPLID